MWACENGRLKTIHISKFLANSDSKLHGSSRSALRGLSTGVSLGMSWRRNLEKNATKVALTENQRQKQRQNQRQSYGASTKWASIWSERSMSYRLPSAAASRMRTSSVALAARVSL